MAPQEAGPTCRLPGFRRRAFWFRSNSVLSAAFLIFLPPPPPPGRGPPSFESARSAASDSGCCPDPPPDLAAPGPPAGGREARCRFPVTAPTQPAAPGHLPFAHRATEDGRILAAVPPLNQAVALLSSLTHTDYKTPVGSVLSTFCNFSTFPLSANSS